MLHVRSQCHWVTHTRAAWSASEKLIRGKMVKSVKVSVLGLKRTGTSDLESSSWNWHSGWHQNRGRTQHRVHQHRRRVPLVPSSFWHCSTSPVLKKQLKKAHTTPKLAKKSTGTLVRSALGHSSPQALARSLPIWASSPIPYLPPTLGSGKNPQHLCLRCSRPWRTSWQSRCLGGLLRGKPMLKPLQHSLSSWRCSPESQQSLDLTPSLCLSSIKPNPLISQVSFPNLTQPKGKLNFTHLM